jgi:hypothetical protein
MAKAQYTKRVSGGSSGAGCEHESMLVDHALAKQGHIAASPSVQKEFLRFIGQRITSCVSGD